MPVPPLGLGPLWRRGCSNTPFPAVGRSLPACARPRRGRGRRPPKVPASGCGSEAQEAPRAVADAARFTRVLLCVHTDDLLKGKRCFVPLRRLLLAPGSMFSQPRQSCLELFHSLFVFSWHFFIAGRVCTGVIAQIFMLTHVYTKRASSESAPVRANLLPCRD